MFFLYSQANNEGFVLADQALDKRSFLYLLFGFGPKSNKKVKDKWMLPETRSGQARHLSGQRTTTPIIWSCFCIRSGRTKTLLRIMRSNGSRCIPSCLLYSSEFAFKGRNKALEVFLWLKTVMGSFCINIDFPNVSRVLPGGLSYHVNTEIEKKLNCKPITVFSLT